MPIPGSKMHYNIRQKRKNHLKVFLMSLNVLAHLRESGSGMGEGARCIDICRDNYAAAAEGEDDRKGAKG